MSVTPDSSGRGNDLTLSSPPPSFGSSGMTVNGQYASSPNTADLQAPGAGLDFSLWGWIYPFSFPATSWIVLKSGTIFEYGIYCDTTAHLGFEVANAGGTLVAVVSTTALATNVWTFFWAFYDHSAGQVGMSLNAGAPAVASFAGPIAAGTNPFAVGSDPGVVDPVYGTLASIGLA